MRAMKILKSLFQNIGLFQKIVQTRKIKDSTIVMKMR